MEGGGAQSFSQMRTSANVNVEEKKRRGRWDEQEAERKQKVCLKTQRVPPTGARCNEIQQ